MITMIGGADAITALQNGAYQSATINVYDATVSGHPSVATFTNANIIQGSLSVTKSCISAEKLELGAAISDQMQVKVRSDALSGVTLKGNIINVVISWPYDGQYSPENAYVFYGVITDARKQTGNVYAITAMDGLIVFDRPYDPSELHAPDKLTQPLTFPISPLDLMGVIVRDIGAPYIDTFAIMRETTPVNTSVLLYEIPDNNGYTYRQVLKWLAQLMGVNIRVKPAPSCPLSIWIWGAPFTDGDDIDLATTVNASKAYTSDESEVTAGQIDVQIVNGQTVLAESSYDDSITVADNAILNSLYENEIDAGETYNWSMIENALSYKVRQSVPTGLIECSFTAVSMWYLEPGDIIHFEQDNFGYIVLITSVTHRLNGKTTVYARLKADNGDDISTNYTIPNFSEGQSNALLAEFQRRGYIVEEGTSGIWKYRKWSSGLYECWGQKTDNITLSAFGSNYGTGQIYNASNGSIWDISFPITFAAIPNVVASVNSGLHTNVTLGTINTNHILPRFWTPILSGDGTTPLTTALVSLQIYVIGRWQ